MTKIRYEVTATLVMVVAIFLLGPLIFVISPALANPVTSVQKPANAIATPDGGWITPPQTTDKDGKPITIQYTKSVQIFDNLPAACSGSATSGLKQEGANWVYNNNVNEAGLYVPWTMPTGSLTGSNGLYYNPVNFNYIGPTSGSTPYDFFQVDFGKGSLTGITQNWFYTMAYPSGSSTHYDTFAMPAVTVSPGSTYNVQGVLEPYPVANPSQYVVQVTLGGSSWLTGHALGYNPTIGSSDTNGFSSYVDQYLENHGTTTLSVDQNGIPALVEISSGSLVLDGAAITGYTTFDRNNTNQPVSTYDVLSPGPVDTKIFNNSPDCTSW
jgi:hypothetical protein